MRCCNKFAFHAGDVGAEGDGIFNNPISYFYQFDDVILVQVYHAFVLKLLFRIYCVGCEGVCSGVKGVEDI